MSNINSNKTNPASASHPCPGPTTPEGKAISSKNARRHGCCAVDATLLETESLEDFEALEQTWLNTYEPTEAERHLVAELVNADWLLQRTTQTYLDIEARLYAENPNPLDWTEHQQRTLGRFLRYKTAHYNMVLKARKAIEDGRRVIMHQITTEIKIKAAIQKAERAESKEKGEPTWKEHLENMRQQAISMGFAPPDPKR